VFKTDFTLYSYLKVLKCLLKDTIVNGLYPSVSKNEASKSVTVHHPFALDDGRTGWWSITFLFRTHNWKLSIVYDRVTKDSTKPKVKYALSDLSSEAGEPTKPTVSSPDKGTSSKVSVPRYQPKRQKEKELKEKGGLLAVCNRVAPEKLERQMIAFLLSIPLLRFNPEVLSNEGIYEGANIPALPLIYTADNFLKELPAFVAETAKVCDTSVTLTAQDDSTVTFTVPYSLDGLHLTGTWKLHIDLSRFEDTNLIITASITVNPVFDYALHPELKKIIQAFLNTLEKEKALSLFDGPLVANESTLLVKLAPIWTLLGICQKVSETYTPNTAIGIGSMLHQGDTLSFSYPFLIAGNMLTGLWSVVLNTKTKTYTVSVEFDTPVYAQELEV
jgi:hypothetical protein